MKEAAASRVAADLCWFFMLFCFFSSVTPALWLLWLFAGVCLLLGFLALRREHAALRLLCTLPALALCLLAPDAATRIVLGIGWVYFALVFTAGRFGMEHWVYRRIFFIMGAAVLLITLSLFLTHYAVPALGALPAVPVSGGILGFGGAFVLLGVYTLRAIQAGSDTDLDWKAFSALELVLPAAAGGALFALLRLLLLNAGSIFTFLITPIVWVFRLIIDLVSLLSSGQDMGQIGGDTTEAMPPEYFDPLPEETGTPSIPTGEVFLPDPPAIPWEPILAVLGIIAFVVLVVLYLRRGKRAANMPAPERAVTERFRIRRRKTHRTPPQSAAERVRQCYAAYLVCLERSGQPIGRGDTSLDILNAPKRPQRSSEEEELRRLYLTARYGDGDDVSAADAEAAEHCLEAIRLLLSGREEA